METQRFESVSQSNGIGDAPLLSAPTQLVEKFNALVGRWRTERGHYSSIEKLCMHDAYQQIIGMGAPVVPLILAEFEARPGHWDWALRAITGHSPVPKESQGRLKEMAAAWIDWGRQKGYRW